MPLTRPEGNMDNTRAGSHFDWEVTQVARVRQLTGGGYQVTMTGTELALIKTTLDEAERVSRFGIEVLDGADHAKDAEPAENSRIRQEIDALAMREASLRSLRKTMAEVDNAGSKPAPVHRAALDQFRPGAALPVPRPRWRQGLWSL
jgi:hypothetical protein